MQTLFILLATAAIITQISHVWYVFNKFSRLEGWLKKTQGAAICGILSLAIVAFVVEGHTGLALAGAFLEALFNVYYYFEDWWEKGFGRKEERGKHVLKFWRQRWLQVIISLILPALIYVFSEMIGG